MGHLLSPKEFLQDFLNHCAKAKKRIWLQSMVLAEGDVMKQTEPLLSAARERGVDVRIHYDWITYRYYHGDIDLFPLFSPHKWARYRQEQYRTKTMLQRLAAAGVTTTMVNAPHWFHHLLPIAGRNHIKLYICDDYVWFGGLNYYDESFHKLDFMVRYENPKLASALTKLFLEVNTEKTLHDYKYSLSPQEILLVDSGKRNTSLILDTAVDMVKSARSKVLFVSQMVPEGALLDAMVHIAAKGVPVVIITSPRSDSIFTTFPKNIPYRRFQNKCSVAQNIVLVHSEEKIHMKLLIVDDSNVLFGSHNLVNTGVSLGTAEASILTHSIDFSRSLTKLIKTHLPSIKYNL